MTNISPPQAGSAAPEFKGQVQGEGSISLQNYRGRKLALYFYPRDSTPGCTRQACNLRDNFELLEKSGIDIIGVSDDPIEMHENFAAKFDLPFPLIADTDRSILTAYGAYGQKKMYGRSFMGTRRMTFLIDETGFIKHVIKKPKVGEHAAEILKWFSMQAVVAPESRTCE